jgi:hypothetical protein
MSRSIWLMALLASAFAAAGASACPGTMAIGLPLLFGSDEPASPWPTPMPQHVVIDLKLPADFEERQEPLAQKELAQECLKVWRDLVRDGRFEIAPIVAAKAAALDPTNLDAQYAVIVSQVLRSIGERQPQVVHSTKAPLCNTACCEADICPACPSQCTANCPVDVKIAAPFFVDHPRERSESHRRSNAEAPLSSRPFGQRCPDGRAGTDGLRDCARSS